MSNSPVEIRRRIAFERMNRAATLLGVPDQCFREVDYGEKILVVGQEPHKQFHISYLKETEQERQA